MSVLDIWVQTGGHTPPASAARGKTEASEIVVAKVTASVDEILMAKSERERNGRKFDEREI